MSIRQLLPLLLTVGLAACELTPSERLLVVEASGSVASLLYLDRDADALPSAGDLAAPNVSFALVSGAIDTVATGTTNGGGIGVVHGLPVGSYRLVVDADALGDSLWLPETTTLVVASGDTTSVMVPLQYPLRTIREVRRADAGKVVAIEGVALNAWTTFGDSTVHVADSTGALRSVRVRATPVVAGDSVRVIGRTSASHGDPGLADATVFVTGKCVEPLPELLSTKSATSADGGRKPAALARIADARVVDVTRLSSGDHRVRVDDGSGVLELFLDRHAGIGFETPLIPGVRIDATGLLIPLSDALWRLLPRSSDDVEARVPRATVSEARALPAGQVVTVTGMALNSWATFGDGTVHLSDGTGAIRVFQSSGSHVATGDSVEFVGVVQIHTGQPVLSAVSSSILGPTGAPPGPALVTSSAAALAAGGHLDAALVNVQSAVIDTVVVIAGETTLRVDDGSGALTVVLDRDTGISGAGILFGDTVAVTGLLIPRGDGEWVLKPRRNEDLIW